MSEYAEIIEGQIITGKNNKDVEIERLKELLRECKKELKPLWDEWLYDYGDKTGNNSARFLRIDDLLTKIDNVIGEKK